MSSSLWNLNSLLRILTPIPLIFMFVAQVGAMGFDPFEQSAINIYPNPVVYEANISLDRSISLTENEVSLVFFNIVGEMVHELEAIQFHDFQVSKDHFKRSGIYLFQLKSNGKVLKTGKINIQ